MYVCMRRNRAYRNHWIVYIDGRRIGTIWFKHYDKPMPGEGDTFMHGDFEEYDEELERWIMYYGITIGWEPENLPNRPGRRNGESKAKMRYRVLDMMVREYRSWMTQ